MLSLASPWWFAAVPAPLLLWWLASRWWQMHITDSGALIHPHADLLATLASSQAGDKRRVPWWWLLGCLLLLIAMARPQWLDFSSPAAFRGHDLMIAVDVSGSMRAEDFVRNDTAVSRLDVVKEMLAQFVAERTHDRLGIIVFADDALTFLPVTTDTALVRSLITNINNGLAGERTALGDAVALAVERLRHRPPETRLLILLTDGANTAGSVAPEMALLLAKQYGIRIYTIGVGTDDKVSFPRGPVMRPVVTELPLDETLLRRLADESGGHYYRAGDAEALQQVFADINRVEPVEIRNPALANKVELYWLPLLLGLSLLLIAESRTRSGILP